MQIKDEKTSSDVSALSVAQLTNHCFIIALSAHDLHRGYCRSMFEQCSIVLADSFGKNRRGGSDLLIRNVLPHSYQKRRDVLRPSQFI